MILFIFPWVVDWFTTIGTVRFFRYFCYSFGNGVVYFIVRFSVVGIEAIIRFTFRKGFIFTEWITFIQSPIIPGVGIRLSKIIGLAKGPTDHFYHAFAP